jgi:DNA repair protein RadC
MIHEIKVLYGTAAVKKTPASERPQVRSSSEGAKAFRSIKEWDDMHRRESFYAIYLNRANRAVGWDCISKGGVSGTVVDTRLVLQPALMMPQPASSVIVAHNHPSGNLSPSPADKSLTRKLREACATMGIALLDHLILTEDSYLSFADEGLMVTQ